MSYADTNLDFSEIKVACLVGFNGSGKSAILDSITWAIWEKARASSEELIRQGEQEMWVSLEFEHLNNLYLVKRGKLKSAGRSSSKSTLEFMILEEDCMKLAAETNKWLSLSGSTIKETETQIEKILKMRFETFINSVYLRQGKADEFTVKSASQRKEVLTEILDLSYYDRLQEKAKIKAKEIEIKIGSLDIKLKDQDKIEEELILFNSKLEENQNLVQKHEKLFQEIEEAINTHQSSLESARIAKAQEEELNNQLSTITADIAKLTLEKNKLEQEDLQVSNLLDKQDEILQQYKEFEKVKSQVEELDKVSESYQELNLKILSIEKQIALEENTLVNKLSAKEDSCQNLINKIAAIEIEISDEAKIKHDFQEYKQMLEEESIQGKDENSFKNLAQRKTEIEKQLSDTKIKLESIYEEKKRKLHELEITLTNQEKLVFEKQTLESKINNFNIIENKRNSIEEEGSNLKNIIATKKSLVSNLENLTNDFKNKISQLESLNQDSLCPLCLSPINDKAKVLDHYNEEINIKNNLIESNNLEIAILETKKTSLGEEYLKLKTQLKDKDAVLKALGEIVSQEKINLDNLNLLNTLKQELSELRQKIDSSNFLTLEQESLKYINAEMTKINFDPILYTNLQGEIKNRKNQEIRYHKLINSLNTKASLENEISTLKNEISTLKEVLENKKYALALTNELSILITTKASLNYNQEDHSALKDKLSYLAKFAQQFNNIKASAEKKLNLQERIVSTLTAINEKASTHSQIKINIANLKSVITQIPDLESHLNLLYIQKSEIKSDLDKANREKYEFDTKYKITQANLNSFKQANEEKQSLKNTLNDYKVLIESLGKKGIQAAIIENAIPEIEAEANRLLQKLSNNQMHIAFSTQAKLKSGLVSETLEILISDSVGTRPYELFSGGEAFRANFAIRIALSKLLTRRSHAKLETLIIDEGFGSQDEESREKLVRTIKSIEDEFACILVISHMNDIKEMFKTQIEVTKNNGQSYVNIINS